MSEFSDYYLLGCNTVSLVGGNTALKKRAAPIFRVTAIRYSEKLETLYEITWGHKPKTCLNSHNCEILKS